MTFAEFFAQAKAKMSQADISGISEDLAFQFNITGEEAGVFYVEIKNGRTRPSPRYLSSRLSP